MDTEVRSATYTERDHFVAVSVDTSALRSLRRSIIVIRHANNAAHQAYLDRARVIASQNSAVTQADQPNTVGGPEAANTTQENNHDR